MSSSVAVFEGVANTPATQLGEIELILGPIFSGKTTELIRRLRRHKAAARRCFLVSYQGDTRYSSNAVVTTHDRIEITSHPVLRLEEVDNAAWHHDVVAIDEGQFLPDLVEFTEKWANAGKLVIVAALDGTFQRNPFPVVIALVPLAEQICKLTAVCMRCLQGASFTWRTAPEQDVEMVGGADKYQALCRGCYARAAAEQAAAAILPSTSSQMTPRKSKRLSSRRGSLEPPTGAAKRNPLDESRENRRRSLQALTIR